MEEKEKNKPEELSSVDVSIMPTEEPLLGSVTTFSHIEGQELKGQQLRSSARVYKKMKLDLSVPLAVEKIEKKEDAKQDTKKCYRPLWTSDEKTIFFEALNEFGKDFDRIYGYVSTKLKKKGVPDHLVKTKDQVRHLYYRTWHKISKYLKFADGIKKVAQELYGLINYGELRKKIGAVNKRCLLKLNELIYRGVTSIRGKGKTIKVKTPMCRALRRLNQLDEKYDEIKLPNRVIVELRPKDMTSFLRVQSIAQNPRIKTVLPLQKRLSSLISCVNKKWRSVEATFYDKALVSVSPITNACIPSTKESDEKNKLLSPPLRLLPPVGCRIEVPSINLSEYFTTQSICLCSYEHRVGITSNNPNSFLSYSAFKLTKNSSKKGPRNRADSVSDKSPQKNNSNTDDNETCEMTDNEGNKANDDLVSVKQEIVEEPLLKSVKSEKPDEVVDQKQRRIESIRKGWAENEGQSLTLGEVYLMFGSESKLVLEYSWDEPVSCKLENITAEQNPEFDTEPDTLQSSSFKNKNKMNLSDSLLKLLSVAKLHYRKNIIECPCGHVCGTKNNAQLKKAVESKIRKILTDFDKCADEGEDKGTPEDENHPSFMAPPVYLPLKIRPISPAGGYYHQPSLVSSAQIDSIRRLKPRYCNRRGRRPRSKQVVVERKLPLLPNRVASDHQIVRMNIISQQPTPFAEPFGAGKTAVSNCDRFVSHDPPLMSNSTFLQDVKSENSDMTLELANDNVISTAPSSPSRILKESDNQWINSEVADYSLSSLLCHLESPVKTGPSTSNLTSEDSRLSQDMGAQLLSLLTESSVDFSANFADLAAQVDSDLRK